MILMQIPNAKLRKLFNSMSPEAQEYVIGRANELYDGTRTVNRCWSIAISEVIPEGK